MFLTRVHDRFLPTALAHLDGPDDHRLRRAQSAYQHAIDHIARQAPDRQAWPHDLDPNHPNTTRNSGFAGPSPLARDGGSDLGPATRPDQLR